MQNIPPVLSETKKYIFDSLHFELRNIWKDSESEDYSAYTFQLNNKKVIFRKAKITPKKIGQFVTFWKRNESGITQPYEFSDDFDLLIINVNFENQSGQFVFPKSDLLEHGIISGNSKDGKRGFRIYPIWDKPDNKQAIETQIWQLQYFIEINHKIDTETVRKLYL